jgi:general secretion pathway protein C
MQARAIAFLVWALVAATAMFWLLRLLAWSPSAPAHTLAVPSTPPPRGDLTRVFGAPPAPKSDPAQALAEPALASRFKLLGVAAPRQGGDRQGLALISVDGKPARGFKVGAVIEGELLLQSVHPRGAALGSRGAAPVVRLELPPLPAAATGRPPTVGTLSPAVLPPGPPIATVPVPPPPGVPTESPPDAPQIVPPPQSPQNR